MNCFNHRDVSAVGLCKSCGKALCPDCWTELTNGLACKDSCESRVNRINRMLDSNAQVMRVARLQLKSLGLFCIIAGIAFCALAVWVNQTIGSSFACFVAFFGVAFTVFGFLRLSRKQDYPQSN